MKSTAKILSRMLLALGTLAIANVASAKANLVANGNFSNGAPASGCVAGTTTLSGWNVTSGNIDIDSAAPGCSGIAAAPGSTYFVDLTGSHAENGLNDVGSISQSLATVVGQKYDLSFYFGGNPQGSGSAYPNDGPLKAMDVFINNVISGVYSINTTGVSSTNAQWKEENILFTATSTSTTIAFDSLNGTTKPSDFGPLLDNVKVTKAPEIDTSSAGAALSLLLGGLVVMRGRRTRVVS